MGSLLASPKDGGYDRKMAKSWQVPKSQLFMNVGNVQVGDIEFPKRNAFEGLNVSPRANIKQLQKTYRKLGRQLPSKMRNTILS